MNDGLDVIGGGGPYVTDEQRWLLELRQRRAAGAYAVATLEDVGRLIAERDEARESGERLRAAAQRFVDSLGEDEEEHPTLGRVFVSRADDGAEEALVALLAELEVRHAS